MVQGVVSDSGFEDHLTYWLNGCKMPSYLLDADVWV